MTNSIEASIWGRLLTLPIIFDCYEGESITIDQTDALEIFKSHLDWVEKSKEQVEAYCHECVAEDEENQKKGNIFSYVMPESIFIKRDKSHPRVALMCRYRYDPEHGLAIVFSNDGNVTVGSPDTIL